MSKWIVDKTIGGEDEIPVSLLSEEPDQVAVVSSIQEQTIEPPPVQPEKPKKWIVDKTIGGEDEAPVELDQPTIQQPEQPQENWFDRSARFAQDLYESAKDTVTGGDRKTNIPEIGSSEVSSGNEFRDAQIAAGLLFAPSDKAKIDIIQKHIPGTNVETDENGIIHIYTPDGRETVLNDAGMTKQDVMGVIGDMLAFTGAGKAASLGKSILSKMAIGGGTAAATQIGLEVGSQALGSEQPVDYGNVAVAGALGAGGEAVEGIAKHMLDTRRAQKIGAAKEDFQDALKGAQKSKTVIDKTKIPLFRAQQTGVLTDLERQSYVASLPGGARTAAEGLKKQNKAAYNATMDVLDTIAPSKAVDQASSKVRDTAQKAIDAKVTIRKEAANPLYKKAFANETPVELIETFDVITAAKKNFPKGGKVQGLLSRVEKILEKPAKATKGTTKKTTKLPKNQIEFDLGDGFNAVEKAAKTTKGKKQKTLPSIKVLHGAKLEIDDMLSKVGEGSLGNTEKRELIKIKKTLLDEMDSINPDYKEAREAFAKASPAVNELEESIIGKIAKLDDTQLKRVSATLFDPAEAMVNPDAVKKAKAVIESQDKQIWKDIVRTEFERRMGTMKAALDEADTIENVPGQLHRALFGNLRQRKALYSALDLETAKNVRYLQEGLKKASLGRPGGSQTAIRQTLDNELKGGVSGAVRNFLKAPVSSTADIGSDAAYNQRVRALAKVMFDSKWKPQLKELRRLNPKSKRAAQEFNNLLKASLQTLNNEE